MKSITSLTAALVTTLFTGQASCSPVTAVSIESRARGAQAAAELLKLMIPALKAGKSRFPDDVDAWEYDKNGYMCEVYMETTDGLNCYTSVTCNDGKLEYNPGKTTWNVCFQGGRQYFNDPRIGEFSVTFTGRDGGEGEGLTKPILQVQAVGNWAEIDVTALAYERRGDQECKQSSLPNCHKGPYICTHTSWSLDKGRTRKWMCGVPKRGMDFPGIDSDLPTNAKDFAPGWCGVHVTQYQKPDPSKDNYSLEAKVFDANQNEIGNSGGKHGATLNFGSKLPFPFLIWSKNIDEDPLDFEYESVKWASNDQPRCSVGAYDNGKREMDCGFTCN